MHDAIQLKVAKKKEREESTLVFLVKWYIWYAAPDFSPQSSVFLTLLGKLVRYLPLSFVSLLPFSSPELYESSIADKMISSKFDRDRL